MGRETKLDGRESSDADEEGFLGRWSRRKSSARSDEKAAALAPAAAQDAATHDAKDAPAPPALDLDSLPDIDSLGPGSDFSVFMQAGVPPALKTRALRKLWRLKPELANLDGLVDYGEDLTGSFKVVDHLKTAYEVGRGFLKDKDDKGKDDPNVAGGAAPPERQQAAPSEPNPDEERVSDRGDDQVAVSSPVEAREKLQNSESKT